MAFNSKRRAVFGNNKVLAGSFTTGASGTIETNMSALRHAQIVGLDTSDNAVIININSKTDLSDNDGNGGFVSYSLAGNGSIYNFYARGR